MTWLECHLAPLFSWLPPNHHNDNIAGKVEFQSFCMVYVTADEVIQTKVRRDRQKSRRQQFD